MYSCIALLLFGVVVNVGASGNNGAANGSIITTRGVVYNDRKQKTCVTLIERDKLDVTLSISGPNITGEHILLDNTRVSGEGGCFHWDLGPHKHRLHGDYKLKVSGRDGDYNIEKTGEIRVEKGKHIVLIETSKPIYKPGDTVAFRVLIIDSQLKPRLHNMYSVFVSNPQGFIIRQWKNQTVTSNNKGFIELELPLTTDTALGRWSISVTPHKHAQRESTHFKVDKYVLPRYEITIDPPNHILRNEEQIQGKVCANYTFGKPLNGRLKLRFSRKTSSGSVVQPQRNQTKLINGCVSFSQNVDVSDARVTRLEVTAVVIENGTEVNLKFTKRVKVTSDAALYQATFEPHSPAYYKPGLPYYGMITVTKEDGSMAKDIEIEMKIYGDSGLLDTKTYRSNNNGQIPFDLPPYQAGTGGLTIRIRRTGLPSNAPELNSHILKEWESPSSSYIQVLPQYDMAQCGQEITLTVLHVKERGVQQYVKLYSQVVSSGQQVHHHTHIHNYRYDNTKIREYKADGTYDEQPFDQGNTGRPVVAIPIKVQVTAKMSPHMNVIVYYVRSNKEVVSDVTLVKVLPCSTNQVNAAFTSDGQTRTVQRPGHPINLDITARPNSLCSVNVVDKSLHLLTEGVEKNTLTLGKVFKKLSKFDLDEESMAESITDLCRKHSGKSQTRLFRSEKVDSLQAFRKSGVVVMSDLSIYNRECIPTSDSAHSDPNNEGSGPDDTEGTSSETTFQEEKSPGLIELEKREYFPESWLWLLDPVGENGQATFPEELPHTITNWTGSAVCIHETHGLGISPPISIRSFQKFFVSLTLPYSVKRTETLRLPVTVFNYAQGCLGVEVVVKMSDEYQITGPNPQAVCVCPEESKTTHFNLKPTVLGENIPIEVRGQSGQQTVCGDRAVLSRETGVRDVVIKELLVVPEGREEGYAKTTLACPGNTASHFVNDVMQLDMPLNVVSGSAKASMICTGDIISPTVEGLGKLIKLPKGCGEQTIAKFAPDVYILRYLSSTNQLNEALEKKTIDFLTKGYQRQLKFRYDNGSYAVFRDNVYWRDSSPNTWLTAFVVRSFAQAKDFIEISNSDMELSMKWLIDQQNKATGCFQKLGDSWWSMGGLKNKENKETVAMDAYILISLMEARSYISLPTLNDTIERGFKCIDGPNVNDTYQLALLAYAHALKNNIDKTKTLLTQLMRKAIVNGNKMHWSIGIPWSRDVSTATYILWRLIYQRGENAVRRALSDLGVLYSTDITVTASALLSYIQNDGENAAHKALSDLGVTWRTDVETTAYVLLALLNNMNDRDEGILKAKKIVEWLSGQRNAFGGWGNTQDTVVALQALSKYAEMTYASSCNQTNTVSIKAEGLEKDLMINDENKLTVQKSEVPVPCRVNVSVTGNGCVLVQARVKYNVKNITSSNSGLEIHPVRVSAHEKNCGLKQLEICTRYSGNDSLTLPMVEVKMVSGWHPNQDSIDRLDNDSQVANNLKKKVIEADKTVNFYLKELTSEDFCLKFSVEQNVEVTYTEPAEVNVYDYYKNEELFVTHRYNINNPCREPPEKEVRQGPVTPPQCPVCSDSVADLQPLVCGVRYAYRVIVRQDYAYPFKVLNDLRSRSRRWLNKYTSMRMSAACQCEQLNIQRSGQKAIILTSNELTREEDNTGRYSLVFNTGTTVIPWRSSTERGIRDVIRRRRCD